MDGKAVFGSLGKEEELDSASMSQDFQVISSLELPAPGISLSDMVPRASLAPVSLPVLDKQSSQGFSHLEELLRSNKKLLSRLLIPQEPAPQSALLASTPQGFPGRGSVQANPLTKGALKITFCDLVTMDYGTKSG